ncbi:MAG TPA: WXG100 family type VII secretion target [Clostridiaceae bacterium]|nr:WXG100 family type VII secretion target [Clostridiaceae bacterium]
MAERITITPQELRTAANNFRAKADEIVEILRYLKAEVDSLESTWDGAAQDQFFAQYNELQTPLNQFPEILQGIASTLDHVATTLEETDINLASQISGN